MTKHKGITALLRTSMMTPAERRLGRFMRAPDGHPEGVTPPAGDPPAAPETVLFPNDGDKPADPPAGDPPATPPTGDWKEYESDPAKSDEENAAAKVEHDKAKPEDKSADDPANVVPEDGKYALKLPDGVEMDQGLADALMPEFKELGLTNGQAQKLVEKYTASIQAKAEEQGTRWSETITKWADDAKADKEIGGDKWDATVSASQRAVKQFGSPALREYLNASGGGNHPELIRFMAKVGAMIKEDSPAGSGAEGSGKPADAAHILFPSDAPKG